MRSSSSPRGAAAQREFQEERDFSREAIRQGPSEAISTGLAVSGLIYRTACSQAETKDGRSFAKEGSKPPCERLGDGFSTVLEWLSEDQPGRRSGQRVRRPQSGPSVRFHQLHKECNSRIRYVKTCPIHGEVSQNEIVLGHEYAKDQYVVVERTSWKSSATRASGQSRSTRSSGRSPRPGLPHRPTDHLVPDGEIGQKPYELIHDAMVAEGLHAVARMVLTKREHIVRLRPLKGLLATDVLEYATRVKDTAEFEEELSKTNPPCRSASSRVN